jgi:peptidoglycan hydrolase-like protein with peptidoglycan-binding domain
VPRHDYGNVESEYHSPTSSDAASANQAGDQTFWRHKRLSQGRRRDRGQEMKHVWRAGLALIAILPGAISAAAVAGDRLSRYAQNAIDVAGVPTRPASVAGAPVSTPANSPEQIRRAQTELKRLDCLTGRIDGKLDDRTREAMKKFWAMAKQPAVDVKITDELISNLTERGDNFCRPPRRFFGFGGHSLPPLLAPGARPTVVPPTAVRPPSPDVDH